MKKIAVILALALMMVVMAMSVSAEVVCTSAWITPAATGTTISGAAYKFNISMACNATNDGDPTMRGNITKVNLSYKLTTDSAWTDVNVSDIFNNTKIQDVKGAEFRSNFDTKPLYDNLIYQIRARGYNGSGALLLTETTLATIYIDNHGPNASFQTLVSKDIIDLPKTIVINAYNASSCIFKVWDSTSQFKSFTGTMERTTTGTETCSYAFKSSDVTEGTKRFVTAISTDLGASADDSIESQATVEYIQFVKPTSGYKAKIIDDETTAAEAAAGAASASSQPNLGQIAFAGAALYGAYWLLRKKKMI